MHVFLANANALTRKPDPGLTGLTAVEITPLALRGVLAGMFAYSEDPNRASLRSRWRTSEGYLVAFVWQMDQPTMSACSGAAELVEKGLAALTAMGAAEAAQQAKGYKLLKMHKNVEVSRLCHAARHAAPRPRHA